MVHISLTNKGIFVVTICGITLLLFLFSDGGQTGYETHPDVVGLRSVFVTQVIAAEEAGNAIRALHDQHPSQNTSVRKKPVFLKLGRFSNATSEESVTEADLVSNYVIIRRVRLLHPDFVSQINTEEREMPQQASIVQAQRVVLNESKFAARRKQLLDSLHEQDVFLHLRQITLWIDPLDATQEYSENLLKYVAVMGCGSIHGEPMFGVVHFPFQNATYWSSLGGQLSENLRRLPKVEGKTPTPSDPLRILVSRSHNLADFSKRLKGVFGSTPIKIIPAGGSGYKMMELARGTADLYVHAGGARRWDLCAPSTILQARGGVVRSLAGGGPLRFHHDDPSDLDQGEGIFAAASGYLYDTWAPVVAKLAWKNTNS